MPQARAPYRPLEAGDPRRFRAPRELDVLIPSCDRPAELAATLAGLAGQELTAGLAGQEVDEPFGVVVSDQSEERPGWQDPAPGGLVRALRYRGHPVLLRHHLPRRGMAEQRAFLLRHSEARYVLYLDDDVWLEPGTLRRLLTAIRQLRCGFVGNAPHGLSYLDDHRPHQQNGYEEWQGPPHPEQIPPRGPEWSRASVHTAANLAHLTERLGLGSGEWRAYKVAWVGACVLFDRAKLVDVGGFDFWPLVPPDHQGEDVVAQLRVLARYGGAGVLPSGAYHLESPTTVTERRIECFDLVPTLPPEASAVAAGGSFRSGSARVRPDKSVNGSKPAEATMTSNEESGWRERGRGGARPTLEELSDAMGVYSADGQVDDATGGEAGEEEEFGNGRRPRPDPSIEPEQRRRPSPDGRIGPA
jgi:Glycosyl transferase family 2